MTSDRIAERLAEWRRVDVVLREERRRELARMSEDEARAIAEDLLSLADEAPPKTGASGLVEQQRIFARVDG